MLFPQGCQRNDRVFTQIAARRAMRTRPSSKGGGPEVSSMRLICVWFRPHPRPAGEWRGCGWQESPAASGAELPGN
jgi:hypothetical protein